MHEIFLQNLLRAFVAIDPVSLIPIFAVLTANYKPKKNFRLAILVFIISSCVLAFFSLFGNNFLIFMGVSIESFQIVGGLFLLFISFEMVFEKRIQRKNNFATNLSNDNEIEKLAVFPISIPLIAGPSAITLSILISKDFTYSLVGFYQKIFPMILILLFSSLILFFSNIIFNKLNRIFLKVIHKLFGLILGAISIQYIINGFKNSFL